MGRTDTWVTYTFPASPSAASSQACTGCPSSSWESQELGALSQGTSGASKCNSAVSFRIEVLASEELSSSSSGFLDLDGLLTRDGASLESADRSISLISLSLRGDSVTSKLVIIRPRFYLQSLQVFVLRFSTVFFDFIAKDTQEAGVEDFCDLGSGRESKTGFENCWLQRLI